MARLSGHHPSGRVIFTYTGKSSEVKPMDVPSGSYFEEEDTERRYKFVDEKWALLPNCCREVYPCHLRQLQ